jgi:Ca2+-binding EF-hand superfamily protein
MTLSVALLAFTLAGAGPLAQNQDPAGSAGSVRGLVFLAEDRPVFLRLRVSQGEQPFESQWIQSVQRIHQCLDRNGDGKLTTKEATPELLTALIRLATGAPVTLPSQELDANPKDDIVSEDELAELLRPILGPFRLQAGRQVVGRTDALFDQLDRDKDGQLTRLELAGITGSLRPLDLDDNEMISADELTPFNSPAETSMEEIAGARSGFTALPSVVELVAGESSLRSARLLLKKYDKGKGDVPGRPNGKLSPEEFAIDSDAFSSFDRNHDGSLDTEELRRLLAHPPLEFTIDVAFPNEPSERATIRVAQGNSLPKDAKIRQLADGDVEIALGKIRLDFHVDDRAIAGEVHRQFTQRFKALDANKDGYLEGKELATLNAAGSPLAGLSSVIDRDGDGKLYLKELVDFADKQVEAARGRLVLDTSDQGRAIFGILDLDRDRRLGAREVMRTVDRVTSWDSDGDGRVSADEIPYHFLVTVTRAGLPGILTEAVAPAPGSPAMGMGRARPSTSLPLGPIWFRKMDRNHDGDVSRREFLGPRSQFDRLDRDKDGLIGPDEAGNDQDATGKPSDGRSDGSRP